jgi:hypothetical protein
MKDTRNRWVAEAVALLLPILIISSPFLFGSRSLDGREFRAYFRSRAAYLTEMSARDGEWPRWNFRQYAGTPLLGDLHGSLHYPPNLLFLVLPPDRALGILFVFHMVAAALGMYRLGRYFEFRRSAAVLGGVAYALSLSVAAHMDEGNLPHFVTPALAPWVLLLILRMIKRASMLRLVLLAAAVGAVLLGGNPQDFLFLVLLGAGLIVWTRVDAGRRKRPWKKSALGPVAVAAFLGLLLSSAAILPALEVSRYAAGVFCPGALARDWRILYVGVLPTVVAFLPFQAPRRGPALFFGIAAALAALPPLLFPRTPLCTLWAVALSLSGLAAQGWDGLARGRYAPRNVARIVAGVGALALGGAGIAFFVHHRSAEAAVILGSLLLSAFILTRLPSRPWAIVAALLVAAADLSFFDARAIPTRSRDEEPAPPWYASVIGPERAQWRLLDPGAADAGPMAHGFRLLHGYGYPRVAAPFGADRLDDLNVRWIVSASAPPSDRWKELARRGELVLFENPAAKPSAYLTASDDNLGPPLRILRNANSIEVEGRTYQEGKLVVSESWMPGWKAYLARHELPVLRSSDGLMQVDIPAGDWYVTFRYEPGLYRLGRLVSSSAVALLFGLLVAGIKRSKIAIS